MKKISCIFIVFLVLTGCQSGIQPETVEQIKLIYWENKGVKQQEETITTENMVILNTFTDAINNAIKLEEGTVITTMPILSFWLRLNDDGEKIYHLWINTSGEGYIQQQQPDVNKTFKLDKESVDNLTKFLNEKDNVEIIEKSIEFET